MGKKIECEQQEVSSTKSMNDKDILNDVLISLKDLSNNYSIATNEMSNKKLFKELNSIYDETKEAARKAYDLAFSKGWYVLEEAERKKIDEAYNKYNKHLKELA